MIQLGQTYYLGGTYKLTFIFGECLLETGTCLTMSWRICPQDYSIHFTT